MSGNLRNELFTYEGLNENFQFLILEIKKQLEETQKALEEPDDHIIDRVTSSGDYVDNLRNLIAKKSYSQITQAEPEKGNIIDAMMSVNTISNNLEKIGDYCENIVQQTAFFHDRTFINQYHYHHYFTIIFTALDNISDSLFSGDVNAAIEICKAEFAIDDLYKRDFDSIMETLKKGKSNHGDLITSLFIFRYLERVGDALLNSGEAIISSVLGTRIKIHQYTSLKETLNTKDRSDSDFELESIGVETRSGCRIEKVRSTSTLNDSEEIIYKEGRYQKLQEEKDNLEMWQEKFPGLTPKIFGFDRKGENASLLMEYLGGMNFQEILVSGNRKLINSSLKRIFETAGSVWSSTREERPACAGFMSQLQKRLNDVYNVHPYFKEKTKYINNMKMTPFEILLQDGLQLEQVLEAPFSVLIHGDFNNDNILYHPDEDRIYYIDIHRSKMSDYVQDVSVFIVSNFRLPIIDSTPRDVINDVIIQFFQFCKDFAEQNNDDTFEARLSLGLIRSFFTSTRFALQKQFAKAMYYRSVYLLESMINHKNKDWSSYRLSNGVLQY